MGLGGNRPNKNPWSIILQLFSSVHRLSRHQLAYYVQAGSLNLPIWWFSSSRLHLIMSRSGMRSRGIWNRN